MMLLLLLLGLMVLVLDLVLVLAVKERRGRKRTLPVSHIGLNEMSPVVPFHLVVSLQKNEGIGILFHGPHLNLYPRLLGSLQGSRHKGSSSCAHDSNNNAPAVGRGGRFLIEIPVCEGFADSGLVGIVFYGIFFKHFVRHAFEVVGERLEGSLEVVLVAGAERFEDREWGLFALQVIEDVGEVGGGSFAGFCGLGLGREMSGFGWGWEGGGISGMDAV